MSDRLQLQPTLTHRVIDACLTRTLPRSPPSMSDRIELQPSLTHRGIEAGVTKAIAGSGQRRKATWSGRGYMRITINDTTLYFDVDGAGLVPDGQAMRERPTVLLLHG